MIQRGGERALVVAAWLTLTFLGRAFAEEAVAPPGEAMVRCFLELETQAVAEACLRRIDNLDDWNRRRPELRRELREMLGLGPPPPRESLRVVVTGTVDREDLGIVVEKLHFQSVRGLYVTANLYRPRSSSSRLPAILYLCGHGRVKVDGVSYGNKAYYQHHPAWFARNGYVCLIIDTLQLGEIEGVHHGTYRLGKWWWVARGYTPAGVEAWNSLRALDLLATRPEVDPERIGVTGRSGGGIGSWWLAALDDRVASVVPVAGITDLRNHILDGCIEGHCDCNYPVNLYRWDYPALAALAAPKPLLLSNSDKDGIFPLDGVLRVHEHLRAVYALHGAKERLGLLITEGPHGDTQDLRVPAFRWMARWLKHEKDPLVRKPAEKFFEPPELRVLDSIPADQINTRIQEVFVPAAPAPDVPTSIEAFEELRARLLAELREKTFRNSPRADAPGPAFVDSWKVRHRLRVRECYFPSERAIQLPLYVVMAEKAPAEGARNRTDLVLRVLGEDDWKEYEPLLAPHLDEETGDRTEGPSLAAMGELRAEIERQDLVVAFVAPRGIGPTSWSRDPRHDNHIRRRFLALGRVLEETRIHDVRRAIQSLSLIRETRELPLRIEGRGEMAPIALYAGIFEPRVQSFTLHSLPASHMDACPLMNVLKVLDLPQAAALVFPRRLMLVGVDRGEFAWTERAAALFNVGTTGEPHAPPLEFR